MSERSQRSLVDDTRGRGRLGRGGLGLGGLLLIVGIILFVIPEPATSGIGIVLILLGLLLLLL